MTAIARAEVDIEPAPAPAPALEPEPECVAVKEVGDGPPGIRTRVLLRGKWNEFEYGLESALGMCVEFRDQHEKIAFEFWNKPRATEIADLELMRTNGVSLKMARSALLISTGEMAKRMKMSRAGYTSLESRAERGEITLKKLTEAAQALGCECATYVRPPKRQTFAERLWEPLLARVNKAPWLQTYNRRVRTQQVIGALNHFSLDPTFRKSQGWNRRKF